MKIAHFWTRDAGEAIGPDGRRVRAVARGWSDESVQEAASVAREVARRTAERIARGDSERNQYGYGDRPLPEPILREFRDGAGVSAMITRNSYGVDVLNTRDMMFVDIDREDTAQGGADLVSGVMSLFGRRAPAATEPVSTVWGEIQRTATANGLAVRGYRTAAGFRALITNVRVEASSGQADALLRQFGADPLYMKLCHMQQSFRARLTPKPWRIGMAAPPVSFPYESAAEAARFAEWEQEYRAASAQYATCEYLGTAGGVRIDPAFEDLIELHDSVSQANSGLPLA